LEKLWIGTSKGKDTHYPVPGSFTVRKRDKLEKTSGGFIFARIDAADTGGG
jgi:hypothetical protein